jgi:tetratricopeptide (TPR) repeat protein
VFEMVVAYEARDWRRVLELDEELRAAGMSGALEPIYLVGDALAATGQLREAEARFARLAVHPRAWKEPISSVRAWRRLGEVRERLGDRAGAIAAHRELVARWHRAPAAQPDLAASRAALARMGATEME